MNQQNTTPQTERQRVDFIPGELVLRVDHDDVLDLNVSSSLDSFQTQLLNRPEVKGDLLEHRDKVLEEAIKKAIADKRIVTFDRRETAQITQLHRFLQGLTWRATKLLFHKRTKYFSLLFVTLPGKIYGYNDQVRVSAERHDALLRKNTHIDWKTGSQFYKRHETGLQKPDRKKANEGKEVFEPLTNAVEMPPIFDVHAATFNWLNSVAQSVPTGGPGTRPQQPMPQARAISSLKLVRTHEDIKSEPSPKPIKVFILDTVPLQLKAGQFTREKLLGAIGASKLSTPLIDWLGNHPNCLKITRDQTLVPSGLPNPKPETSMMDWLGSDLDTGVALQSHYDVNHPEYDMSAHGLFIADILCRVTAEAGLGSAPDSIELVEVLSKWGTGTIETLVRGLMKVYDEAIKGDASTIIVNCSFTMAIPRGGYLLKLLHRVGHRPPSGTEIDASFQRVYTGLMNNPRAADRIASILEPIFQLLTDLGVIFISAAGNEWENDCDNRALNTRPIARYPAALDSVIGVAALNDRKERDSYNWKIASYSNRADEPANVGFATYGGSSVNQLGKRYADPANSIQGLYVGCFPDGVPSSQTGWLAQWAGTSFAAPIVTGAFVVKCAEIPQTNGKSKKQLAFEALQKDAQRTDSGESIIWVEA